MFELQNKDKYDKAKARMLKRHLKGRDITSERVLKAMAEVPLISPEDGSSDSPSGRAPESRDQVTLRVTEASRVWL